MKIVNLNTLFAITLTSLVAACGGGNDAPPPDAPIAFRQLQFFPFNGPDAPITAVVQNEPAWYKLWVGSTARTIPVPDADFQTETVLFYAIGMKPYGAWTAAITSVTASNGKVIVKAEERLCTGADILHTQALIYPTSVVSIPKTTKEIVFNVTNVNRCDK